jgi:alpha-amylase/alpha-mannosidase (GH57 family)
MKICIHGHFYQPPREDPFSNYIPDETGAEPFRNWNERILFECYQPNAKARNFEKLSFNVGPTLFNWLADFDPEVSDMIIKQEQENYHRFGVGNGMAQGYNHLIMPLATLEDKITQVRWGIEDFYYRFGHKPDGLWLPETAVDLETLCVLSDCGIKFTILAPWQVIPEEASRGPFLIDLPNGREPFIVFTYDQELSTQVSFNPSATVNGDLFLDNLLHTRPDNPNELVLIASDGELYGHHQPFRDYFLSYLMDGAGMRRNIEWTYPAKWLQEHKVTTKARLVENSSWSCMHGVDRWKQACGCTPNATWKAALREALNKTAVMLDTLYMQTLSPIFSDPWELRHRYIEVLWGKRTLQDLCYQLSGRRLTPTELNIIQDLLSAQYERQRMFTSCGFFHDEFYRLEPQNNIAYAAKAVYLTERATGAELRSVVTDLLQRVQSEKTSLRGDTVFSQTMMRAQAENAA